MSGEKMRKVENVKAFLAEKGMRSAGPHTPRNYKRLAWPVCSRCGLVYLKNEVTAKAARAVCVTEE
jgi:hypothetical protein